MGRHVVLAALVAAVVGIVGASVPPPAERVIHVTAKRFEFDPSEIHVRRGEPVVLELEALDREHGFAIPKLGVDAEVVPGQPTRVRLVPTNPGRFRFACNVFCGSGHEDMAGELVVE